MVPHLLIGPFLSIVFKSFYFCYLNTSIWWFFFDSHVLKFNGSVCNIEIWLNSLLKLLPFGLKYHANYTIKLFPLFLFFAEVYPSPIEQFNIVEDFYLEGNFGFAHLECQFLLGINNFRLDQSVRGWFVDECRTSI